MTTTNKTTNDLLADLLQKAGKNESALSESPVKHHFVSVEKRREKVIDSIYDSIAKLQYYKQHGQLPNTQNDTVYLRDNKLEVCVRYGRLFMAVFGACEYWLVTPYPDEAITALKDVISLINAGEYDVQLSSMYAHAGEPRDIIKVKNRIE